MADFYDDLRRDSFDELEDEIANKETEAMGESNETPYGIGLDVGTGFLVSARVNKDGDISYASVRDCFFGLPKDDFESNSVFNKSILDYIVVGDTACILGSEALEMARVHRQATSRPLSSGVLNTAKEKNSRFILEKLIACVLSGHVAKNGEKLVFSVPGPQVGNPDFNVEHHAMSLVTMLSKFGVDAEPVNEAHAVVISELSSMEKDSTTAVSGLGLSFGAGLVNCCAVHKGMPIFEFSIPKSGDYIDQFATTNTSTAESKIIHIKETQLDLTVNLADPTLSEEIRSLAFGYKSAIQQTVKGIANAFNTTTKIDVPDGMPIIISGGTSMPKGFVEMFKEELGKVRLPFEVGQVIPTKDRLKAVAKGCMLKAIKLEQD